MANKYFYHSGEQIKAGDHITTGSVETSDFNCWQVSRICEKSKPVMIVAINEMDSGQRMCSTDSKTTTFNRRGKLVNGKVLTMFQL